jgi:hypothetical protein
VLLLLLLLLHTAGLTDPAACLLRWPHQRLHCAHDVVLLLLLLHTAESTGPATCYLLLLLPLPHQFFDCAHDVVHLLLAQEVVVHKRTRAPADGLNPVDMCGQVDATGQQLQMRSAASCCEACWRIHST